MPGQEDCDLVQDLRDAAAGVLEPAHETNVAETNSRVNPRVDNEISQHVLRPKGSVVTDM